MGDAELGRRYLDALMPMVWVACEREDFVVEVQAMRRRVACTSTTKSSRSQATHTIGISASR
ncbi:hypothetical protein MAHJHV57_49670 [Mycobacterium avium subsp. hominissuis]